MAAHCAALTTYCHARCSATRAFSSDCRCAPGALRRGRNPLRSRKPNMQQVRSGIELDWSDPDTLTGAFAAVLGIAVGIGAPLFYISRDRADDKRLDDLRELNRQNYKETGKYLTEEEIRAIRQPRWTDRREFQDDD